MLSREEVEWEMMNKYDTWHRDDIVCPHCGYVFSDSWEFDDRDCCTVECQSCDEPFELVVYHEVYYTTRKLLEMSDEQDIL